MRLRSTSWGSGASAIRLPRSNGRISAIAAGDWGQTIALTSTGTAESIGAYSEEFEAAFANLTNIKDITSETMLLNNGEAIQYSAQIQGQTATWIYETFATNVKSLARVTSGSTVNCVITSEDLVECYDRFTNEGAGSIFGFFDIPNTIVAPIQIACAEYHCLVLQENGKVLAWGDMLNFYEGRKDAPPHLSDVKEISVHSSTNYAVLENGRVVTWGNIYTPPGLHELFSAGGAFQRHGVE